MLREIEHASRGLVRCVLPGHERRTLVGRASEAYRWGCAGAAGNPSCWGSESVISNHDAFDPTKA